MGCWCGYLSGARCRLFANSPADATTKGVRRILVRKVNAPLSPEAKKILKSDYKMVQSEVYLNKYVVSIAPFSTPAFTPNSENCSFLAYFRFLIYHPFFQGGVS